MISTFWLIGKGNPGNSKSEDCLVLCLEQVINRVNVFIYFTINCLTYIFMPLMWIEF